MKLVDEKRESAQRIGRHLRGLGLRVIMAGLVLPGSLFAQGTGGDAVLLDMRSAFSRGNNFQLANLLPSVRGHALEPLAQYWEARARLGHRQPHRHSRRTRPHGGQLLGRPPAQRLVAATGQGA
jgi:hypothetical protein